jgi:drug/metabolite transporter, DME family
MSKTLIGIILSLTAGACLSTGGIALRLVDSASGYQILFYRALTFITLMAVVIAIRYRGGAAKAIRDVGWAGVFVSFALGVGATLYVLAIVHTTVANAVVILCTSPLLTALLAWICLGHRASRATIVAALVAVSGVILMVVDGMAAGGLTGMTIALGAALAFAGMLVVMQRHQGRDFLPATGMSGFVTLAIAWFAAGHLDISNHDIGIGVFLGSFQFGLGFVCITLAARYIDGALVALLSLSEVILAPIWVWLGVGEAPSTMALVGGVVVLLAVAGQTVHTRATTRP